MTAAQLALIGYPVPQQSVPAAQPTADDLAAIGTGPGVGYYIGINNDAPAPTLQDFAPQPTGGPQMDAATLSAIAQQPPSDPNGLTTGPDPSPTPGQDPTPANAGNMGVTGNPSTNPYTPGGAADQGTVQQDAIPTQAAPVTPQPVQGFPQFGDWAKANGLPRQVTMEERKVILEKYLDQQKEYMGRMDPAKIAEAKLKQHEVDTLPLKDQNIQATTAESQSKVIAGELAKQQAMDAVNNQLADLQTQKENLEAVANHPELKNMTGMAGQYNPGITDPQRDLKARLEQISGQQLIGGINKIKDEAANPNGTLGLRITQQEALAVKNAVQRLQRYQDPKTFSSSANEAASFLDRAIQAKQAQLSRMPGVNADLLKQFNYAPASANNGATGSGGVSSSPAASSPVIKTIPGRGTFQSLGNGQWKQIQ